MGHRPKRLDGSYGVMIAGEGVPPGGGIGQFLEKTSAADYDTHWGTVTIGKVQGLTEALDLKLDEQALDGYVMKAGSVMTGPLTVPTEPYNINWNGNFTVPTKDAIWDQLQVMATPNVWGTITGTLSNQSDLQAALNAKAPVVHTHVVTDVIGLNADLASKAPLVHTHVISDVSGLQPALDAKVDDSEMANYTTDTELTAALGAYAPINHSHALFTSSTAGFAPASGGGAVNFLRADGTWAAPPGGGGGGGLTDGDKGDVLVASLGESLTVQSATGPGSGYFTFSGWNGVLAEDMYVKTGGLWVLSPGFGGEIDIQSANNIFTGLFANDVGLDAELLMFADGGFSFTDIDNSTTFASITNPETIINSWGGLTITGGVTDYGYLWMGGKSGNSIAFSDPAGNEESVIFGGSMSGEMRVRAAKFTIGSMGAYTQYAEIGPTGLTVNGGITAQGPDAYLYVNSSTNIADCWLQSATGALDMKTVDVSGTVVAYITSHGDFVDGEPTALKELRLRGSSVTMHNDTTGGLVATIDATGINLPTGSTFKVNGVAIGGSQVDDTAYAGSWNGVVNFAPSKNAVYDKIEAVIATIPAAPSTVVSDTAYGASWDGVTGIAPSKNAVYDKIEALSVGGGGVTTFNTRSGAVTLTAADVTAALPAFTGHVTSPAGSPVNTIPAGTVTLAMQANMATASIVYRKTAGAGAPEVQSLATLKADLAIASDIAAVISDTAYAGTWNGVTAIAPSKNAVYDQLEILNTAIGTKANTSALANYLPLTGGAVASSFPINAASNILLQTAGVTRAEIWAGGLDLTGATGLTLSDGSTVAGSILSTGPWFQYKADAHGWLNKAGGTTYATLGTGGLSVNGLYGSEGPSAGLNLASRAGGDNFIISTLTSGSLNFYSGGATRATLDNSGFDLPAGATYKINGVPVGGGGLADADYGDVLVSGGATAMTVQSAGSDFTANGAILLPTATASPGNVTASAHIYYSAGSGLVLKGAGTTYDVTIASRNSALIMTVDSLNVCKFWVAPTVSDLAYSAAWDNDLRVPTRNAVYDKIEAVIATIPAAPSTVISDTAYAGSWDGITGIAPSKNAVYDKIQAVIATIPAATTSIVGITGTIAQFNTAVTDADLATTAMLGTAAARNIHVGTSAPGSPATNDLWVDTT